MIEFTKHCLVETETGSMYEVLPAERKIRKLPGGGVSTERFGDAQEWRTYEMLALPAIGTSMIVLWGLHAQSPDAQVTELMARTTVTSYVVSITPVTPITNHKQEN